RGLLVSRARATGWSCVRNPPSERTVWCPPLSHRARRVPARRECTGAASIVALDRDISGRATVCLKDRAERSRSRCGVEAMRAEIEPTDELASLIEDLHDSEINGEIGWFFDGVW